MKIIVSILGLMVFQTYGIESFIPYGSDHKPMVARIEISSTVHIPVLTWNIWANRSSASVSTAFKLIPHHERMETKIIPIIHSFLKEHKNGLVALQEVSSAPETDGPSSIALLKETFGEENVLYKKIYDDEARNVHFGNVMIFNPGELKPIKPIEESALGNLETSGKENRGRFFALRFITQGVTFDFYNVHFNYSGFFEESESEKHEQTSYCGQLYTVLEDSFEDNQPKIPVIFAGDFNTSTKKFGSFVKKNHQEKHHSVSVFYGDRGFLPLAEKGKEGHGSPVSADAIIAFVPGQEGVTERQAIVPVAAM